MIFTIRSLLPLCLIFAISVHAANPERQRFKELVLSLSTRSQAGPLQCEEAYNGKTTAKVQYKFTVTDDPNYVDAFTMLFSSPSDMHKWSTLVAYEGYREYVMGKLEVIRIGSESEYIHRFNGYFEDVVTLHTANGVINLLNFAKVNKGVVYYELNCPLK